MVTNCLPYWNEQEESSEDLEVLNTRSTVDTVIESFSATTHINTQTHTDTYVHRPMHTRERALEIY